jgi:chromosome partitioning protein
VLMMSFSRKEKEKVRRCVNLNTVAGRRQESPGFPPLEPGGIFRRFLSVWCIINICVDMSCVIAIANQKGGVGKTTTAINLGASLAVAERRTLIIDIDPQANASSGLGLDRKPDTPNIYDVLVGAKALEHTIHEGIHFPLLDLVPSTRDLVGAEIEMVSMLSRETVLRRALETVRHSYDFVLIDCPPSLGLLTLNTLTAADSVLIPIQCEFYALEGLSQLLNTIRLVQRALNPDLRIEGVLLTMYDQRLNLSNQVAADAREYFGSKVFRTAIPRNVRLAEAPSFGEPIIHYDVLSKGAQSYLALAKELLDGQGSLSSPAGTGQEEAEAEE